MELPGSQATEAQIHQALASSAPVALLPISAALSVRSLRMVFAYDLVVVPESSVTAAELASFGRRALDVRNRQ